MAMKLAVGDKQRAMEHLQENLPTGTDVTFVELQGGDGWGSYKILIACVDQDTHKPYIKDITQDVALVLDYKLSSSKKFLTGVIINGGVDWACMKLCEKVFPDAIGTHTLHARYYTSTGGIL